MYSMWLNADEQTIWRDYLRVVGALQTAMNRQLHEACGMTLADYDVLVALSEGGRSRIRELGAVLGWEQSRLSHQLRRMRERGLVRRSETDDDGRGACVELTPAGRSQLRAAAPGHAELVRSTFFGPMSPAQARALRQWLPEVLERLDAPG
ncbi:MAG TPA: MarR family winged helix-turn-helix transcriptional regulator [Mycobacterium sp.]|nr:MarR family winged helix-turn-helix transcriptional regulator [Mycobacterium sp.]